ncbi:Dabb family protein [Mucilaginibacter myungsuensis]|uniref:Dabb family protein n=1 Tax=Mucilaginibacter myungsuensis TaxID=649104 RepID=A0A929PYY8_9SPHI|nr:Dabb family protein [Mucilaginibacter myungsuensis]MBE9663950.1 Dabb family protein [Mucilaginibacter myungsuensis]MDN3598334.1 Dabb family protein [Mucilaginibacter myungsuensis]
MLLTNTFSHQVYFWLNDKADKAKLIEGLKIMLPITSIRQIHIGVPAESEEREVIERSYDISLLVLFDSLADHDHYQVDPLHDIFREQYAGPLCKKVMVLDSVDA